MQTTLLDANLEDNDRRIAHRLSNCNLTSAATLTSAAAAAAGASPWSGFSCSNLGAGSIRRKGVRFASGPLSESHRSVSVGLINYNGGLRSTRQRRSSDACAALQLGGSLSPQILYSRPPVIQELLIAALASGLPLR